MNTTTTELAEEFYTCLGCGEHVHVLHQPTHVMNECGIALPKGDVVKFDRMLKLEEDVKNWRITEGLGIYAWDRQRGFENRIRCQEELFSLLDGLNEAEREAFGMYRKA